MTDRNRRNVLKAVGSAGVLLAAGGIGTVAARGPPSEGDTIVDTAIAVNSAGPFAGQFDTLVAAVIEADLVDALSGNRQLTVFAPTDAAFQETLGIGPGDVGAVDDDLLRSVLTYHVAPGRRDAESVTTSDEIPTLNGALVEVDGTNLNGDQADIVVTDVVASNGIIHAIDGVLLP